MIEDDMSLMTTTGMTGTSTQENSHSATNTYHLIVQDSWKIFSEIHIICDNKRILVANEEDIRWKSISAPFRLYEYVRCQSVYGTNHK
ncbi:hypothetical protein T01_526 [Trichinella spiralis]|uniref:Uncharacterized protein n=1 Tax=Trichinella spiralis TaxID=6334 RepID=A0A0V1B5N0_TRISP|nr:hypothetical protein T01_526 [Trichinella spiralis]